jgi:hypothetical protein
LAFGGFKFEVQQSTMVVMQDRIQRSTWYSTGAVATANDCQFPIADFRLDSSLKDNWQLPIGNRQSLRVATAPVLYRVAATFGLSYCPNHITTLLAVMGLFERHGEVRIVLSGTKRGTLHGELNHHVEAGSTVYTDACDALPI